mgnify:CR=1 FL=1|tara:strand:+ start:214 stop:630 length:417 start_codon:yes stop_codon:yes gene_type:complete
MSEWESIVKVKTPLLSKAIQMAQGLQGVSEMLKDIYEKEMRDGKMGVPKKVFPIAIKARELEIKFFNWIERNLQDLRDRKQVFEHFDHEQIYRDYEAIVRESNINEGKDSVMAIFFGQNPAQKFLQKVRNLLKGIGDV